MVNRQVVAMAATVLAGEVVADENLPPSEFYSRSGPPDEIHEPDDRRSGEDLGGAGQTDLLGFEDLRLATDHEHDGSAHVADVEGLVVLVEDKDGVVHPADTSSDQGCHG